MLRPPPPYPYPPPPSGIKTAIAIPSDLVRKTTLREATVKLGYIARAAAIFRVNAIAIYQMGTVHSLHVAYDILYYHLLPPYLKRYVGKKPHLRYVGTLPPLKTPSHTGIVIDNKEFRQGIVVKRGRTWVVADIGKENPIRAFSRPSPPKKGQLVWIAIDKSSSRAYVSKPPSEVYTCPSLETYSTLEDLLSRYSRALCIGTSRYGTPVHELFDELVRRLSRLRRLLILFGGPDWGLFDILPDNLLNKLDYIVNTFPAQGVETVRVEEAILGTLAVLSNLLEGE